MVFYYENNERKIIKGKMDKYLEMNIKLMLYGRGNENESNYVMDMSYKYMPFIFTSYDFFMWRYIKGI